MNLTSGFNLSSSKSSWLRWFGGVVGVIAISGYSWLALPSSKFEIVTLLVMGGFFLVTLGRSFLDVCFLDRETRIASEQVRQLVEINDVGKFLESAQPSLFKGHIQSLYTIFRSDPEIEQDHLIEITHARLMARNKVVELFSSILVTLGLVGTIAGLINSTSGLGQALTSMFGDGQKSEDLLGPAMIKTFSGLSTAFNTTLLGAITGGVTLRLLNNVVDAAIMQYVAHLAELTEVNVLPALRRMAAKLKAQGYYSSLD